MRLNPMPLSLPCSGPQTEAVTSFLGPVTPPAMPNGDELKRLKAQMSGRLNFSERKPKVITIRPLRAAAFTVDGDGQVVATEQQQQEGQP